MNEQANVDAGLLPHEYEIVVAPCLQVAAELAASRNDPTLYNDLASMLALRELVREVSSCYLMDMAAIGQHSSNSQFEHAPIAVSAMVLEEFDVPAEHITPMLNALERAEAMLNEEAVAIAQNGIVEQAYLDLKRDRYDRGMNALTTAGSLMVAIIDEWEQRRSVAAH